MRYAEFFAGIGGFRYGLEKCNDTAIKGIQQGIQKRSGDNSTIIESLLGKKQFTCVYANEWDKYACQIYRKNFGDKELHEGDITKITAESIPDFDLFVGGFPCQPFSIAGKQKGFDDTRGTAFFEVCRIAEVKKPRLILLENVKGLLNHEGGQTFTTILNTLSELGYDCEWEVLNSKNFGVPQNRERVFIIGHLRGTGGQKIFPIGDSNERINEGKKQTTNIRTLQGGGHSGGHHSGMTLIQPTKNSYAIDRNYFKGTSYKDFKEKYRRQLVELNNNKVRRLTPTECERLQGFPDGWTEGISDTQRYKCLGNAVTTNVITEIGRKILLNDNRRPI